MEENTAIQSIVIVFSHMFILFFLVIFFLSVIVVYLILWGVVEVVNYFAQKCAEPEPE